jgi:diguanylate cyclase (GGDEF)-like protein/PAS domain S-box-containing protein
MELFNSAQDSLDFQRWISDCMMEEIWITDLEFHIQYASPSIVQRWGYSLNELRKYSLNDQLSPQSLEIFNKLVINELKKSNLEDTKFRFSKKLELEFHQKGGALQRLKINITLLRNENGTPNGFICISRDIQSLKRIRESLSESESRYRTLFEGLPLGLYQTTPDGIIINVNPALVRMLKYPNRESLLSLNVSNLFAQPVKRYQQKSVLASQSILLQSETEIRCHDGSSLWVRDNAHVVRNGQGKIVYYEGSLEDISAIRNAEKALRDSEVRYRNLVQIMGEGLTIVDSQEKILFSNPAAENMFGVAPGKLIGHNLKEFMDPSQVDEILLQTDQRKRGEKSQYEVVIVRPDSEKRHLLITATPQYDANGQFISSFGVFHDITLRRQYEQTLEQTRAQLSKQVQELDKKNREMSTSSDMMNMLQNCTAVSETYSVIARFCRQLFPEANGAFYYKKGNKRFKLVQKWGDLTNTNNEINVEDCWGLRREKLYAFNPSSLGPVCAHLGRKLPGSSVCVPITIDNEISAMLHLETDEGMFELTEDQNQIAISLSEQISLALSNVQLKEKLHEQAIRDSLTGLYNRYYMEEALVKELSRAHRSGKNIGLIMLDFDRFKELNTLYGHPKADDVLRDFGILLNASIRGSDIACRYGGDEFLIIMPETTLEILASRSDQLRNKVKELSDINTLLKNFPMTVSIGIAVFPRHGRNPAELLKSADDALMEAKKRHDCVVIGTAVDNKTEVKLSDYS